MDGFFCCHAISQNCQTYEGYLERSSLRMNVTLKEVWKPVTLMKVCHTNGGLSEYWRVVTLMEGCHTSGGLSH